MSRLALIGASVLAWAGSFMILRLTGSWLVFVIAGGIVSALWLAFDRQARESVRWEACRVGMGVAAGLAQIAATYALWPLARSSLQGAAADVNALYALMQGWSPPVLLRAALLAFVGGCEEIAFRSSTLTVSAGSTSRRQIALRIVVMAALYAIAQATSGNRALIAVAFLLGVYWGIVRVVTGSVVSAAIAHAMWDIAVMIVYPLS